jgi:hypothetical protein
MRRAGKINPFDSVKPEEAKQILDQIKSIPHAFDWFSVALTHDVSPSYGSGSNSISSRGSIQ